MTGILIAAIALKRHQQLQYLITLLLDSSPTGALKSGRGPKHLRPRKGGIHGNPVSRNHPRKQLPTGTVTLKPYQWKNTLLTPILTKKAWNLWRKGRTGSLILHRFAQNRGRMIHEITSKTSKVPWQQRGGAEPLQTPCIMSRTLRG